MVPTTKEIVMQLRALAELHPKDKVSDLASKLGLSPIFIINALDEAEQSEFFKRKRDKKGVITEELEVLKPIDWGKVEHSDFGSDYARVEDEIYIAIENANKAEQDLELGTIMAWCRGINPSAVEIGLKVMVANGQLSTYELSDPADKKSKYTFHTLPKNVGKEWGKKQFKAKKGKK